MRFGEAIALGMFSQMIEPRSHATVRTLTDANPAWLKLEIDDVDRAEAEARLRDAKKQWEFEKKQLGRWTQPKFSSWKIAKLKASN